MAFKERLKGLTAKLESTYLTDSVPTITEDGIQIEENIWGEIEIDYLEENLREQMAQAGLGRAGEGMPAGQYGHVTVTVPIKGTDAAFSASKLPEMDVLLRMAGMTSTLDATPATENIIYTPRSSGFESASVYAHSSGSVYELVGCFAQLTELSLLPAQYGRATLEIWGVVSDIVDLAHPAITYIEKAVKPPNITSAGLTLNSFDLADFSSFILDMRTELPARPRGNAAGGHAGYEIVDWDPHARIIADKTALSSFNPYTLRSAGTRFAWDIGVIGATQWNRYAITGSAGRMVGHPHTAEDGMPMWDMLVRLENSDEETADDAFAITFT